MALRLLLLVVASVVLSEGVEVPFCASSLCPYPVPNDGIGDAVMADGCICPRGREEGTECTSDDHCAKGTSCSYGKDLSKTGVTLQCTNKCSLATCPQYHRCELVNNEPVCRCRSFDCNPDIVSSVDAVRNNVKQTFRNKCEYVNTNCELLMLDPTSALWKM